MIAGMASQVRRLFPDPAGSTSLREAYNAPRPAQPSATGTRPWVSLCMIASLDGAIVIDGRSGGLGNPTDHEVLLTLREYADVVLVGAGTARGEGYGPPSKAGLRVGVVTNSGSVDLSRALFTSGAGFVIAPESAAVDSDAVEVLRAGEQTNAAAARSALALIVDTDQIQLRTTVVDDRVFLAQQLHSGLRKEPLRAILGVGINFVIAVATIDA